MEKTNKILLKNLEMIENAFSWMLIQNNKKIGKKKFECVQGTASKHN